MLTRYVRLIFVYCNYWLTEPNLPQGTFGGTGIRPEVVSHWLKHGRKYTKPPVITNSQDYGNAWLAWWATLQPTWRRGSGTLPSAIYQCENEDWGKLRLSGKNGMFLVLVSMVWWGRANGMKSHWSAAVTDVKRVLESMVGVGAKQGSTSGLKLPVSKRVRR
jgi:hypothetical protein